MSSETALSKKIVPELVYTWKIIIKFVVPPSGAIHACATSKKNILFYNDVLSCCDSLMLYYTTFIGFLFSYFSIYKDQPSFQL
jgi:hypothetical protein